MYAHTARYQRLPPIAFNKSSCLRCIKGFQILFYLKSFICQRNKLLFLNPIADLHACIGHLLRSQ